MRAQYIGGFLRRQFKGRVDAKERRGALGGQCCPSLDVRDASRNTHHSSRHAAATGAGRPRPGRVSRPAASLPRAPAVARRRGHSGCAAGAEGQASKCRSVRTAASMMSSLRRQRPACSAFARQLHVWKRVLTGLRSQWTKSENYSERSLTARGASHPAAF